MLCLTAETAEQFKGLPIRLELAITGIPVPVGYIAKILGVVTEGGNCQVEVSFRYGRNPFPVSDHSHVLGLERANIHFSLAGCED